MIIPKGGFQKIKQESEAVLQDTWYVLPIDDKTAKIIVVDKCGKKRDIGDVLIGEDKFLPLNGTIPNRPLKGNVELAPSETSDGFVKFEGNSGSYLGFEDTGSMYIYTRENLLRTVSRQLVLDTGEDIDISYGQTFTVNPQNSPSSGFVINKFGNVFINGNTVSAIENTEGGTIAVTRDYIERPQTLIKALNNCDAAQLAQIKTILGI